LNTEVNIKLLALSQSIQKCIEPINNFLNNQSFKNMIEQKSDIARMMANLSHI